MTAEGGFPEVDFKTGECTFCEACVKVCQDGALRNSKEDVSPWQNVAAINSDCLSAIGVTCRVCGDRCDARAIQFTLAVGGIATPVVDHQDCTGCGACVQPCPTASITINQMTEERSA